MKKTLMIIGAVVLALALAGGGFYGGTVYQRNQANTVRNNFLRSRGLEGTNPGAPGGNGQSGGFFGGPTGQVKSIDGNTLTLTTGQNDTKVTLSDTTRIEKPATGTIADIQPSDRVMVTGQRDANGNITATQVLILSTGANQPTSSTNP